MKYITWSTPWDQPNDLHHVTTPCDLSHVTYTTCMTTEGANDWTWQMEYTCISPKPASMTTNSNPNKSLLSAVSAAKHGSCVNRKRTCFSHGHVIGNTRWLSACIYTALHSGLGNCLVAMTGSVVTKWPVWREGDRGWLMIRGEHLKWTSSGLVVATCQTT